MVWESNDSWGEGKDKHGKIIIELQNYKNANLKFFTLIPLNHLAQVFISFIIKPFYGSNLTLFY